MRRIIAYIYHYQREGDILRKYGNTGFCRVEQNCDKDSVTLCLKDGCGVEGKAYIYTLKESCMENYKEKTYEKIKLDKCGEACFGGLNIKLCFDKADGIYVECGGRIYVALWKDNYEVVRVLCREENTDKNVPSKKITNIENQKDKSEQTSINKNAYIERNQSKKEDNYADYTRIYNRLGKVRIVLEDVEYPAVKLKPYELMFLPRSCWRMANNIFLMESYYRHGHILFMEYNGRYVLAVPWILDKRMVNQGISYGFSECLVGYEYGREREKKFYFLKYL